MKINWIIFCSRTCIVLLLSVYSTTGDGIEEENEQKCSFDFTSRTIKTYQGSKLICANLFLEKLGWAEAQLRCTLLFSQLTQRIYLNSSLHKELLDEGVDLLWIGIHRRANFFVTEHPSKLFREADEFSLDHWGYHWSEDEPGFGDCVAVNTATGSLHTRNCKEHLPFICDHDESLTSTVNKDLCPKGWLLSFSLSTVYRTCIHPYKALSHSKAKRICKRYGAQLASSKEYDILDSTDQIIRNYLMKAGKFWIPKEKKNDPCRIKILGSHSEDVNKIADVNCSNSFPFICLKHYETERITAHLSPSSMPLITTDSHDEDLLKCDLETDSLKMVKNGEVRFQWYKDDLPVPSYSYVIRIGFTGSALKRDPYTWDVVTRQGNYHCEVSVAGSIKTYPSPKLKFSYSDIATFVIEIQNIEYMKSLDFSHQDFTERMEEFDETFMSRVLGKLKLQYPRTQWDFNSISVQNGTAILKILVYIHRNDADDDFDDITACEEVKEAFAEQQSIPVYLGNATFHVNCRDFPDAGGYNKIMKNLKAIKKKLDNMEETQTNILGKLKNMELIHPVDDASPAEKKFAFDIELILRAAEDLKQLSKSLFTNSPENTQEVKTFDDRERNILEDILPSLGSKKYQITSKKSQKIGLISFKGPNPHSKSQGIGQKKA